MRRLPALLLLLSVTACAMFPPSTAGGPGQKFVVFFTEWSAGLDDAAQSAITAAAGWARKYPDQPVTVTGFADPTGSAQANIDLSRTRAQVVYDQLVQDGVDGNRIQRSAKGETNFNLTSQESRRVEITVGSL